MTMKYVNHIMWSPQTKEEYSFTIHGFRLTLRNLGEVILPILFTWIIVHLGTIHPSIFHKNTIHNSTIIENTDIIQNIHTIHTNTIHYLYWRHFLPISTTSPHEGKPVSNAIYRIEHNHVVEEYYGCQLQGSTIFSNLGNTSNQHVSKLAFKLFVRDNHDPVNELWPPPK